MPFGNTPNESLTTNIFTFVSGRLQGIFNDDLKWLRNEKLKSRVLEITQHYKNVLATGSHMLWV